MLAEREICWEKENKEEEEEKEEVPTVSLCVWDGCLTIDHCPDDDIIAVEMSTDGRIKSSLNCWNAGPPSRLARTAVYEDVETIAAVIHHWEGERDGRFRPR